MTRINDPRLKRRPRIKKRTFTTAWIRPNLVKGLERKIVAVIPIHEGDVQFLPQLLKNMEDLDWGVSWHLDHVSDATKETICNFPLTVACSTPCFSLPFIDTDRQAAWDAAVKSGAEWVVPHDADEVWEPATKDRLPSILTEPKLYIARWLNVWNVEDFDQPGETPPREYQAPPLDDTWIRVSPPSIFIRNRPRFYPVSHYSYVYTAQSALPYCVGKNQGPFTQQTNLRILHYGLSTQELRQRHYDRWNGEVKSDMWKAALDPDLPLVLKKFNPGIAYEEWTDQ